MWNKFEIKWLKFNKIWNEFEVYIFFNEFGFRIGALKSKMFFFFLVLNKWTELNLNRL